MKQTYPIKYGKETWKQLQEIARFGYSSADILRDFVEVCLSAILSLTDNLQRLPYAEFMERLTDNRLTGVYEERYLSLVAKYKENTTRKQGERPADFFRNAWNALQHETAQTEQDVLGEIYESQISLGEHGQFFTPTSITEAITQMLGPYTAGETVSEPTIGSGRFFITLAQHNRDLRFVGTDVSPICARMAALNMWLFDLNADIYQGNSLSMEMSYLWRIRRGGFIWEEKIDGVVALPLTKPLPVPEIQAAAPPVAETPAQQPQPVISPPAPAQPRPGNKQKKKREKKRAAKQQLAEQQKLFDVD
jgi:type I restriction-modification system DNA methylase subunit